MLCFDEGRREMSHEETDPFFFVVLILEMLALACFAGCVSISTHERAINQARTEENNRALYWASQVQSGDIGERDFVLLLKGRADVLQMERLKWQASQK